MTRPARRRRSTCCWPRPGASPGRSPAREQGSAWPGGTVPLCRRLRPSRSTTPGPSARGPRGRPSGRAQRLHRTSKQASTSPKPPQSGQKNVPEHPSRWSSLRSLVWGVERTGSARPKFHPRGALVGRLEPLPTRNRRMAPPASTSKSSNSRLGLTDCAFLTFLSALCDCFEFVAGVRRHAWPVPNRSG